MNSAAWNESENAIQLFWQWFAEHSLSLSSLHQKGDIGTLASLINDQLDRINPELAWELGPGRQARNSFTITGEGNQTLGLLAKRMISAAPELKDWELYESKQPRVAPSVIRLPERSLELSTSGWQFSPLERPTEGRIDLLVISDELASIEREAALRAVAIYLDDVLGEDTVEEWLGRFEVVASPPSGKRKYPLSEIVDYVFWATHREKNPIAKNP